MKIHKIDRKELRNMHFLWKNAVSTEVVRQYDQNIGSCSVFGIPSVEFRLDSGGQFIILLLGGTLHSLFKILHRLL